MAHEQMNDPMPQAEAAAATGESDQTVLEEFSIVELEERLEFEAWCDYDCSCPG